MRVRKIAKQLKRHYKSVTGYDDDGMPIHTYNMRQFGKGCHYIMRMTRRNYFGYLSRARRVTEQIDGKKKVRQPDVMMIKLYIHKACSPYLFDNIMAFWGCPLY